MSASDGRADRLGWFDDLYRDAGDDPGNVPWQRSGPHPGLVRWAQASGRRPAGHRGCAIDVGCGLGDNAEYLAGLGYEVTAFDLSGRAVDWARRRFPGSAVAYRTADLFDLPAAWERAFDLVSEIYTLQALPADLRPEAVCRIADLAGRGGRVLVVCMGRDEGEEPGESPPFPLARSELRSFLDAGLTETAFEDVNVGEAGRRHFVAVYARPPAPGSAA